MKKILLILLVIPFCITACRKDPSNKNNSADKNYAGSIIQGKMKNVINTDGGAEHPYVLVLMAGNKAKLVSLNGEATLNYHAEQDKIVLDDNGYFNLSNGQITDWVIAGLNFSTAILSPQPATSLRGKKFAGNVRFSNLNFDFNIEVDFDAATDQLSFSGDNTKYNYTAAGNVAAYLYDAPSKSSLFLVVENGKLNYQTYNAKDGMSAGLLDPKL